VDVVVSDVRMPGMSGIDLLTYVKQVRPAVEVILMTAYATVDTAVLAIKRGAYDYITKPFTTQELLDKLDRLFASRQTVQHDHNVQIFGRLVARSPSMKRLFEQLHTVAPTDRTILLCGESGTGKELFAEAIHNHSARSTKPFVRFSARRSSLPCSKVNCSATRKVRLPGRSARRPAGLSWPAPARCCSMRSTTSRPSCR